MTHSADAPASDASAHRNVAVLVAAQAILGAQMPILFIIGGLVGKSLSPNPCLATLPISMIVFGSMTTAPWLSPFMQRHGRRAGFVLGTFAGGLGAAIAALGLVYGSFGLLLAGSFLSGIYMSAQGFYRFAATDTASDAFRPRAISYVMAGGLLSALVGPQLNKLVIDATVIPFIGSYFAIIAINLLGSSLFLALDLPRGTKSSPSTSRLPSRSRRELLRDPVILVAVICGMVSYALMNLVMTSTPLAMIGCGFTSAEASDVVSAHVVAMYLPSFFTGALIVRFGAVRIMAVGLGLLMCAGLVALSGVQITNFFAALILLGAGWNFGFIGATSLLSSAHAPHERGAVQGLNDTLVFGCVTFASLASGGLLSCSGGSAAQGWSAVNIAMVPFLMLAGASLIWLTLRIRKGSTI